MSDLSEPIAVVGMACSYPRAENADELWSLIIEGRPALRSLRERFQKCEHPDLAALDVPASLLEPRAINTAAFGIPPVQAISIARMQLLVLDAVQRCLADAGYQERALTRERTDVYSGLCFGNGRHLMNALRVESAAIAQEFLALAAEQRPDLVHGNGAMLGDLRIALEKRFPGSPHDRVGEMASTIPARVAIVFKLQGRTVAIESADATSFVALEQAILTLRTGDADAVVLTAGQTFENPVVPLALAARGLLAREGSEGIVLGEGVAAMLLKRLSTAIRDGDRIYSMISGIANEHDPKKGTFRYGASADKRKRAIERACTDASTTARALGYVEYCATGFADETRQELEALAALAGDRAPLPIGSVKSVLGHTFANAGLAAIAKTVLALHRRVMPPNHRAPPLAPFVALDRATAWPPSNAPRTAGVSGVSLTGTVSFVVLEEYDSRNAGRSGMRRRTLSRTAESDGVAIVGYGGIFADAPDARTFWRNNEEKRETLRPLPESSFPRHVYYDPSGASALKSYTDIGSSLEVPEKLPPEVRIPPLRLAHVDPTGRLALHVASEVLRSYGLPGRPLPRGLGLVVIATNLCSNTERSASLGVHYDELERGVRESDVFPKLGETEQRLVLDELRHRFLLGRKPIALASLDGFLASGIAAMISNELGIEAVPVAIEGACAGSHAAIDIACRALRSNQFHFAIAGGIELGCHRRELVLCSALGLLSRTKITPFDAAADGFSPGDGAALFLLRRFSDAKRAREPIRAVIRAIGSSNDSRSLIAPTASGQELSLRRAFEQLDFVPSDVQYVEAHGTGTSIGDDVEISALASVYGEHPRAAPLAIASVKSMIGHTLSAAGSAGLLRTLLAMKNRTFPPSINVARLNPKLVLDKIPGFVNTEPTPWPQPAGAMRRAAVSSFGTGGINYHLLLEDFEE